MDLSTGALIVVLLGAAALIAGVALGFLLYQLDRRERGVVTPHERRAAEPNPDRARRPHAA